MPEKCFRCGCDDTKCVIVPCRVKGKSKFICVCCISGECECK
jgi:hypothetical protein